MVAVYRPYYTQPSIEQTQSQTINQFFVFQGALLLCAKQEAGVTVTVLAVLESTVDWKTVTVTVLGISSVTVDVPDEIVGTGSVLCYLLVSLNLKRKEDNLHSRGRNWPRSHGGERTYC
jgi:hypothetical protein